jgi:chromosome segregation ATPase
MNLGGREKFPTSAIKIIKWEVNTMSVMIEQDLKEYFKEQFDGLKERFDKIDDRFDKIDTDLKDIKNDVKKLEIGQTRLDGEISNVKTELTQIKTEVSELKRSQDKQIWALILVFAGAVAKFGFFPNVHF